MSKFGNLAAIGAISLGLLATTGATAAFASTTGMPGPTPCPTQTIQPVTTAYVNPQPTCTPTVTPLPTVTPTVTPTPRPVFRPEFFRLRLTRFSNSVQAFGPVFGFGSDVIITPTFDRFLLPNVFNRVNVLHAPLPFPRISFRSCSVTAFQFARWAFAGGTGRNLGASGFGNYTLFASATYPRLRGVCSLRFLVPGVNPLTNTNPFVQPRTLVINVNGSGLARA